MRRRTAGLLTAAGLLVMITAGTYTMIASHYTEHFFENTTINGINVSDLNVKEAEALIAAQAEDYSIQVLTREGNQELITGEEIGYKFVSGGEVQELLESQNIFAWLPAYLGNGSSHTVEAAVTWDEELLVQAADALDCMQKENITKPKNAKVVLQEDGTYGIRPEVEGNKPDPDKVAELLKETVSSGSRTADLEAADCYRKPKVRADDAELKTEAAVMNRYSSISVTYYLGGGVTEVLDKSVTSQWFTLDEDLQPQFDRDAVSVWVNQLADRYDTIGAYLPFRTSNGETVYPESRTYGWQMDRESETEALYQVLVNGESAERSPVWHESAQTRDENDIGNTYVEIDYTNQRMWYYRDGVCLVETPVVTGNVSADMASPEGVFCLVYKEEDAILRGEDYETPVDYWMPFYGGVGIHDADSWRTSYGGDIYKWSGSHGCINTPSAQAEIIYQNIEPGTPVVCYSSGSSYGYSQITVDGTAGGQGQNGNGSGDIVIIDGGDWTQNADSSWEDAYSDGGSWDDSYSADNSWEDAYFDDSWDDIYSDDMIWDDVYDGSGYGDLGDWADESLYYGAQEEQIIIIN